MKSLKDAIPETPDNELGEVIHYVLEGVEGVEVGLAIAGAHVAGALGLGIEVAGPVAGMAAVFVALGNAHAEAINHIIKDQMYSGFSRGVVLGADARSLDFVKSNFVMYAPVSSTTYPEYGARFQGAFNRALAGGYGQGKNLSKKQRGLFFEDLYARMSVSPKVTYGPDYKQWSERTWIDYYIECAAIFRRYHMKDES